MADEQLHELSFDELIKRGVQYELDAVVQGRPLKSRVYDVMSLAVQWANERQAKPVPVPTPRACEWIKTVLKNSPDPKLNKIALDTICPTDCKGPAYCPHSPQV